MPEDKGSVPVSQVDQIGAIFSDFAPTAPAEPAVPAEPTKPGEPVKPAEPAVPVVAEPAKPVEPVKDEKDVAIQTLTDQVAALSAKITELAKPKEPAKLVEPAASVPAGLGYFKDKAEYEAAFEKPEVMSEVMQRVEANAVNKILKTLPQVINNTIKAQLEVQTRTAAFYKDNEDLGAHKEFVGYVANDMSGKNPDWTLDKLFVELPGEVRKRIGLKAGIPPATPAQPVKKGGARLPAEKLLEITPLEEEIRELM